MIMMDPHKAVISIMKKRNEKVDSAPRKNGPLIPTDGELDARHMAAEDVMNAFHSKNIHHLKEALGNFHDLHAMHNADQERQTGPHDSQRFDMESDLPEL